MIGISLFDIEIRGGKHKLIKRMAFHSRIMFRKVTGFFTSTKIRAKKKELP